MITKADIQKLKKVLGHRYSSRIAKHLSECNVANSNGKPYTRQAVNNIINSTDRQKNIPEVVQSIIDFTKSVEELQKENKEKIKRL